MELDFRVPGTTPDLSRFRKSPSRTDIRLPTVVVLIGANGSGKTTLLRAMRETARFMTNSFANDAGESLNGFMGALSSESQSEPTRIELEFDAKWPSRDSSGWSLCRYTLELCRDKSELLPDRIGYEALHVFPKGRPRRMFERRHGQPVHVAKGLGLRPSDDRLSSIPRNASVISTLGKLNVEPFASIAGSMGNNMDRLGHFRPDDSLAARMYQDNPELVDVVSGALPRVDLGIKNMRINEQRGQYVPEFKMEFDHHGLSYPVVFPFESSGTQQLVRMYPYFHRALERGNIALMDDFYADLHADLALEIVCWFQRIYRNSQDVQLICSSHNFSLLDDLEKEEVFITEKDRNGSTRAYGVRQVSGVRRTENLQNLYRSGALGGIPIFG